MSRAACALLAASLAAAVSPTLAGADPLRLRGEGLATLQAPAGLVIVSASDRGRPWLEAEAVVWAGAGGDQAESDALVMVIELRARRRRAALRLGRQLVVAGALPALHLDGAAGRIRLPRRVDLEAFAGLPVVPRLGPRAWDWVVGARLSRPLGRARVGVAWLERRDHGALATHELALDGNGRLGGIDVTASGAWDLIASGLAEARVAAIRRGRAVRLELFVQQRSPAHLLPATSLFSVLGDVPARLAGGDVRWQAAPRLDLAGTAAVRVVGGDAGADLTGRATLRLGDRAGDGALGLELRRQDAPDAGGWCGVRGTGRLPLAAQWSASVELELVVPDDAAGRGAVWPWGLIAVTWRHTAWELAGALLGSASPEYRGRVDALLRLERRWELP